MPSEILAIGDTDANSADVVIAAGEALTVCLKDAAGMSVALTAQVLILLKDDAGQYFRVDELNGLQPARMLIAAGTYRFSRVAGTSCGVFSA